jgi:hypothetical protein
VYTFGGIGRGDEASAEKYNLINDEWIKLPDMPQPSCYNNSAVFRDKIYINGTGFTDSLVVFDPGHEYYEKITLEKSCGNSKGVLALANTIAVVSSVVGESYIMNDEGNFDFANFQCTAWHFNI